MGISWLAWSRKITLSAERRANVKGGNEKLPREQGAAIMLGVLGAQQRGGRRVEERPMLNRLGWAGAFGYAIGAWVYSVLYIWEHWGGLWNYGALAYYAFMRALVWPLWVFLDLI